MISLWTRYTNYILFYFLRYVPSGRVGGVMDNGLLRSNWQLIFKKIYHILLLTGANNRLLVLTPPK